PFAGGRQCLDALHRDRADVEEAEDGAPRRRHRHRDPERDDKGRNGECERAGEALARTVQALAHAWAEVRLSREVDLPGECDEGTLELSHRTPSAVRAHAPCGTSRFPTVGRAPRLS